MISDEMLDRYERDAVSTIRALIGEIVDLKDALSEMTDSRDFWQKRCEKAEAENNRR